MVPVASKRLVAELARELARLKHKTERLATALEAKDRDLTEANERQSATAEVLHLIGRAPADAATAMDVVAQTTARMFGAESVAIRHVDGNLLHSIGRAGPAANLIAAAAPQIALDGSLAPAVSVRKKSQLYFPDVAVSNELVPESRTTIFRRSKIRSLLVTPLMRNGKAIGVLNVHRAQPNGFDSKDRKLLEGFAVQAAIVIENARLLTELRTARDAAELNLVELRAAQANMIQSEKMASLGQLAAGIAHEIKNPLNFINNFAELSVELLNELRESDKAALDLEGHSEIDEIFGALTGNLVRIAEHGRRADGIVKSMLAHSGGGSGERQIVNLNALVEESLDLAVHGARAQDSDFNIALERVLDTNIGLIEADPQHLTRVFLNLIDNGFYAANKRRKEGADRSFTPTLKITTSDMETKVAIRVRDNGAGISPEIRGKLFQPFFTTKPTGEGTGLGLSISYEIVTREHGGTIEVESEPGHYAEFVITIPRRFGATMIARTSNTGVLR